MKFTPKSEIEVARLFEKGEYKFKVIDAVEKTSQKGNAMIELNLEVYHNTIGGKTNRVRCFLMTSEPNFEFLIRHFCYSVGIGDVYESGNLLASTLPGKCGAVSLGIETDKDGKYPDKNRVLDFLVNPENIALPPSAPVKQQDLNDDIPF